MLSINDDDAPIKAQNIINNIAKINEEINEDEYSEDEASEDHLTEFELWQSSQQQDFKTKQKKAKHSISDNMSSTYQRLRAQNDVSGIPRMMSDMKALKSPHKKIARETMINEEDLDISEYLDNKINQNAKITGRLKSTLSRLDQKFGKHSPSVISENNSSGSGEDNE